MKPVFKHGLKGFKGHNRSEKLVYCNYNDGELIIARKMPDRETTEDNRRFGRISSNIHKIFNSVSSEYKLDLANYALALQSVNYDPHKMPSRSFSIFNRMMWTLKKRFPEVDLETITKDKILANEYPVRSVLESMENGILLDIPEARMLDRKM